ncbi:MAG: hypothetical protein RLZZ227_650 [Pseudomonadota bacterium]|jgi:tight adherence protein B
MDALPFNALLLIAAGAAAICIASIYLYWKQYLVSGNVKIRERRTTLEGAGTALAGKRPVLSLSRQQVASPLDKILLALPFGPQLDRYLEQAGAHHGPAGAVLRMFAGGGLGFGLGLMLAVKFGPLALTAAVFVGSFYPLLRLRSLRKQRLARLVKQLPEAMDFFARSLRAGNPFIGALKAAPKEMSQPIARELEITFEEMNYGLDFEEVMQNLARRVDAEEVRFFVTAVLVQKTTGGNLAEIMNRIAALLRERIKTRGEVMIQAAEMKASAHVLFALPFFIAGVLQLLSPGYFKVLLDSPSGQTIVMIQIALMVVGYFVMNRMVNFRI